MTLLLTISLLLQDADSNKERDAMLKATFDALEKGIRENDEKIFKPQWLADAYEKNLVGGSGIAGSGVLRQGARKKWFPKPDFSKAQDVGEGALVIVPCDIWSWEREKVLDHVNILLVKTEVTKDNPKKAVFRVLGAGEKRAEVEALAERFQKKEPLEPPKKEEK